MNDIRMELSANCFADGTGRAILILSVVGLGLVVGHDLEEGGFKCTEGSATGREDGGDDTEIQKMVGNIEKIH